MGCSGSLAPRFVNNDYLTAETICSTAHARLKGSLGHRLLSAMCIYEFHESGSVIALSWLCLLGQTREKRVECVCCHGHCASQDRPCVVLGYGSCCTSQERINVSVVLESPSSLLAYTLSTLRSAGSMNSKTIGVRNRISDTVM